MKGREGGEGGGGVLALDVGQRVGATVFQVLLHRDHMAPGSDVVTQTPSSLPGASVTGTLSTAPSFCSTEPGIAYETKKEISRRESGSSLTPPPPPPPPLPGENCEKSRLIQSAQFEAF